jgi:hypothetical protein
MDPDVRHSIHQQQQQVLQQQEQYQQKLPQQQHQATQDDTAAQETMSCWTATRSLIKFVIDALFVVWMIQACWKTNFGVTGIQECPSMYNFTHIYSTIGSVLAVLGILSMFIVWCLMMTFGEPAAARPAPPVEMDV